MPERVRPHLLDEGAVGGALDIRQAWGQHLGPLLLRRVDLTALGRTTRALSRPAELQPTLTAAGQLQIDLGQQLRVDQRAVQLALRRVDAEAGAQPVQRVAGAGEARARDRERVDHAIRIDGRPVETRQFRIQEADIEGCVVRDQPPLAEEIVERLYMLGEGGSVAHVVVRDAMDGLRVRMDRTPLGRDVDVKVSASRKAVHQLDRADLDHAVAVTSVQAGGLGIEDDVAHGSRSA